MINQAHIDVDMHAHADIHTHTGMHPRVNVMKKGKKFHIILIMVKLVSYICEKQMILLVKLEKPEGIK